ncbi:MAG: GNAT family N-acetyltransferase [Fischerella sp.]|nr:GNAT family N-acetyltransferase [Fischerella sp.]
MLLIDEVHQHKGIGTAAYRILESNICSWNGIKKVRIGIILTNEIVLPFWKKLGFIETGEIKSYRYDKLESEIPILEKELEIKNYIKSI